MSKKHQAETFEVTCPECGALLKIDVETRAVIAHTPAVRPKTFADLDAAARAMHDADSRRDSIFRQSVDKKFREALKKAKESPDTGRPIRDFDLD